jgi:hypothetical protein
MSRQTVIKINWPRDVTETSQQEQFVLGMLGSLGTAARRRCRLVHFNLSKQLAASRSLLNGHSVHHVAAYHVITPYHIQNKTV